jgi:hypothetical protein
MACTLHRHAGLRSASSVVHAGVSGWLCWADTGTYQGVGWRIYVDYTNYQNWPVGGRRRALDERRLRAEPTVAADTVIADTVNSADDNGNRSGHQYIRISGHDHRLRTAGQRQQRRRDKRRLRAEERRRARRNVQRRVIERSELDIAEFHASVIDDGPGIPVDAGLVERPTCRSCRAPGGGDRHLQQPVGVADDAEHDHWHDGEPVWHRHVQHDARTPEQYAARTGDEPVRVQHGHVDELHRDFGTDAVGDLSAVAQSFPSAAARGARASEQRSQCSET